MPPLAQRNLFHDKMRLSVTLTGVVFAVVLIAVELGLFVGFNQTTSNLIDHAGADLWVAGKHVPYVEQAAPFSERKLYQVRALPGVEEAQKLIVRWMPWKRSDGGQENVLIVGLNPNSLLGRPWNLVSGAVEDLKKPDSIIVDELYLHKLGVSRAGEVFEVYGHRARVVGFTRGIRAFTTAPVVFTSIARGQAYTAIAEDQTTYVLVKAAGGTDLQKLRQDILSHVKDVDVFTSAEFSHVTRSYWLFSTGAGVAVLLAAILGLVVGFVVVAQTIYATTTDHIREFGTLKALGASNRYVYKVILKQAAIAAMIGYALGMAVCAIIVHASQSGGAAIIVPWPMAVGMFFLTLFMCMGAAMVSIIKVTHLDPAMVFKA